MTQEQLTEFFYRVVRPGILKREGVAGLLILGELNAKARELGKPFSRLVKRLAEQRRGGSWFLAKLRGHVDGKLADPRKHLFADALKPGQRSNAVEDRFVAKARCTSCS